MTPTEKQIETGLEDAAKIGADVAEAVDPALAPEIAVAQRAMQGLLDVIRKLIDKVPWFSEGDHQAAHSAVNDVSNVLRGAPHVTGAPAPAPAPAPVPDVPTADPTAAAPPAAATPPADEGTGGAPISTAASVQEAPPADPTAPAAPAAAAPIDATTAAMGSDTAPAATGAPDNIAPPADVAAWLEAHGLEAIPAKDTTTTPPPA